MRICKTYADLGRKNSALFLCFDKLWLLFIVEVVNLAASKLSPFFSLGLHALFASFSSDRATKVGRLHGVIGNFSFLRESNGYCVMGSLRSCRMSAYHAQMNEIVKLSGFTNGATCKRAGLFFTPSLKYRNVMQGSCEYQFYSHWFDST